MWKFEPQQMYSGKSGCNTREFCNTTFCSMERDALEWITKDGTTIYDNRIFLWDLFFCAHDTHTIFLFSMLPSLMPHLFFFSISTPSPAPPLRWMNNKIMCVSVNIYIHVYACTINFYYLHFLTHPPLSLLFFFSIIR